MRNLAYRIRLFASSWRWMYRWRRKMHMPRLAAAKSATRHATAHFKEPW